MLLAALFKETTSLDFTARDVLSVVVNTLEQEAARSHVHGNAAGPEHGAPRRGPGMSGCSSCWEFAALPTRTRQNKTLPVLQGLDHPGRGKDGVPGYCGREA